LKIIFFTIRFLFKAEHSNIPVVCVVVEGGTNTIRMVLEHVTDNPPVPVVVCDGSGRAADLISFTHRYARDNGYVNYDLGKRIRYRNGWKLRRKNKLNYVCQ